MPKDKMGHELNIGDRIVYLRPRYHQLMWGTINGFTGKMVQIERDRPILGVGFDDTRAFDEVLLDTHGWQKPDKI